jgi:hypothetical protein
LYPFVLLLGRRKEMNRDENIRKLEESSKVWDIAVIGGGSSGLGSSLGCSFQRAIGGTF